MSTKLPHSPSTGRRSYVLLENSIYCSNDPCKEVSAGIKPSSSALLPFFIPGLQPNLHSIYQNGPSRTVCVSCRHCSQENMPKYHVVVFGPCKTAIFSICHFQTALTFAGCAERPLPFSKCNVSELWAISRTHSCIHDLRHEAYNLYKISPTDPTFPLLYTHFNSFSCTKNRDSSPHRRKSVEKSICSDL
jgi:hypothetical protein